MLAGGTRWRSRGQVMRRAALARTAEGGRPHTGQLGASSYQPAATNCQLPTTSYQLPTTNYQLPTTSYRLY